MAKYNEKSLFVKTEDPSVYQSSSCAPDSIGSNVCSMSHGDDVIRESVRMFARTVVKASLNRAI